MVEHLEKSPEGRLLLAVVIFFPAQLSDNFIDQNTISMALKKCSVSSVINNVF